MPLTSILDERIQEELVTLFGQQVLHLEHNKFLTLALTLTEGLVSNDRLRYTLNLHKHDITKMLKELCTEGYLSSDGIGRGTTYQLNLTSSESNLTSSESNLTSSEPNQNRLFTKRKYTRSELHEIILHCTQEWKSLEQIAHEINRNSQYLKGEVIPKMLSKGLLQREFPIPNHPAQRYKRNDDD